jgi:hypothetical protein
LINKDTNLKTDLISAYENTNFVVSSTPEPFILNIDVVSVDLQFLYSQYAVQTASFITAYNPFSETLSKTDNEIAQQRLLEDIEKSGYLYLRGIGSDPSGEWEGEPSFLILGISKELALELGTKFKQNAIVWSSKDCVPKLLLLR